MLNQSQQVNRRLTDWVKLGDRHFQGFASTMLISYSASWQEWDWNNKSSNRVSIAKRGQLTKRITTKRQSAALCCMVW